jgi:sugar phosphate permease
MASTTASKPGGWYYGWNIVAVSVVAALASNGVPLNCISLYLLPWSTEMHVPISEILLAMTVMMLFMGISAAVIGGMADRKPARLLVGFGLIGLAIINLLISVSTKAWQIEAIYALLLPVPLVAATSAVTNPLVSRWFVKRLGLALGVTSFGIGLAGIVLPPIIAQVMPQVGWRIIFQIWAAIVGLVVAPAVFLVMRERPTEREGLHYVSGGGQAGGAHGHGHGGGQMTTLEVLKRKNFWFVIAVFLPLGFIYIGAMNNLAPITVSLGFSAKIAGYTLSTYAIAHVCSTLIIGMLADRFGNRLPLVLLAFVAAGAAVALGLGHNMVTLFTGAALAGFAGGIWVVMPSAAAIEFGPANVGKAFGLFSLVLPLHSLVGAGIARAKEVTGSYTAVMLAIAVACAVGGVIAMFMRERQGGHPTPEEKTAALQQAVEPGL